MARDDGFAVMDVSSDIANGRKFRRIQRQAPDLVAVAMTVYVALLGESWKAGRRVPVDDGWPTLVAFDQRVVDQMTTVGLLDRRGLVTSAAWRRWFEPARARRAASRDRWARYNANRHAVATSLPRGNRVATATSVPSVRSKERTVAPRGARATVRRTNGHDNTTCPGCGDELHPTDPGVTTDRDGQLWHEACPPPVVSAVSA